MAVTDAGVIPAADAASIPTGDVPTTVADILAAAADLLEKPGAWIQGAWFDTNSKAALEGRYTCMCAEGAIALAARIPAQIVEDSAAYAVFADHVEDAVSFWNDAPERTQAEVVAAFRAAAERARTDSSVGTPEGVNQ